MFEYKLDLVSTRGLRYHDVGFDRFDCCRKIIDSGTQIDDYLSWVANEVLSLESVVIRVTYVAQEVLDDKRFVK